MKYQLFRSIVAGVFVYVLVSCAGRSTAPLPTPSLTVSSTAQPTPTHLATATPKPPSTAVPNPSPLPSPSSLLRATIVIPTQVINTPTVAAERRYTFPVRSRGAIRYGRYHHDYPAADIFCPVGSEFVAVTSGVVDFVSREDHWVATVNDGATRGGLAVAIIGDDGVRYYGSHLSAVAEDIQVGTRVVVGQLLGRTGKSGDAANTAPHLHFGISHPTTPDDWAMRRGEIAPYPYLQQWQHGKDVAPTLAS